MPLTKQPVNINFSQGIETKQDPKQVEVGKFLALQNSVFDKAGALTKRDGFPIITTLPNTLQTTLTTLNNNLIATGSDLYAYSADTNQWLDQGKVQPIQIATQSVLRASSNQTMADAVVATTGLACVVYMDTGVAYYQITDSATGQQIVPRVRVSTNTTHTPRCFILGNYFIVTFISNIAGVIHLQYIPIPIAIPTNPLAIRDISSLVSGVAAGYDATVLTNGSMYISWAGSGNTVKTTYITPSLVLQAATSVVGKTASTVAIKIDETAYIVYVMFHDGVTKNGYIIGYDYYLNTILFSLTQIISNVDINRMTATTANGTIRLFYDVNNTYSYAPNTKTDYIQLLTITQAGVINPAITILRSVALASKAFLDADGRTYMLATYGEVNQPTYFLIDSEGAIYARIAYANGGGYVTDKVLPNVSLINGSYYVPYAIKDLLTSVNKNTNLASGTVVNGIYTQTGINLLKFSINTQGQQTSEIANTLHLTGGQLWQYDGVRPVEQGFHVWPESVSVTTATGAGSITAGIYYYAFCYEWTDNQGNLHRSAPSLPTTITTTTGTNTNTINVPTLRLTYKVTPNPVRIVGYRWSVAQQTYYQFTSITSPILNDTTIDSVTITDTLLDATILGQTLLYTTGGVLENIAAPASTASALFKNRLFLIDAEDQNLLWFSKQVIQNVPVEMSDLLTIYVAPTSGSQGSTGPMRALGAMDDKLIIFKKDAIYYITGAGPDNTGANSDFSDPIFITSSVGSTNPNSIVLMPNGIMFQSDKGIWLLGRDLQTTYIGAPADAFNSYTVVSSRTIPGTNQVRFYLDNSITLVYNYYYNQWGTFSNISAISSTLFNGKDTYINALGKVYQETAGTYLDGATPVLLSFSTAWISLAGIQGMERFYSMYILGTYKTPFKLQVEICYDFNDSVSQSTLVLPDNYTPVYGASPVWGSTGAWGSSTIQVSNVLEIRVFPKQQKCETFKIIVSEIYDNTLGIAAGEGLTLSGITLIVGTKRGYRANKSGQSFG